MGNREHRRANKHAQERHVRKTMREIQRVREALWDEPYLELDEPVFWGYRRYFVLRKDIAMRNDADEFLELLDAIQYEVHSKRKDFKVRDRFGRWFEPIQRIGTIPRHGLAKVPKRFRKFFRWVRTRRGRREYRYAMEWMFELRIKKVYTTHIVVSDRKLRSEKGYLENVIDDRQYGGKWDKLKYGRFRWRFRWSETAKPKLIRRYHEKEIREALIDHHNDNFFTSETIMEDNHAQTEIL